MRIRPIQPEDIPALFDVRVATDQNRLTRAELTELGITESSVLARMERSFRGWLCEMDQRVVGFAMGDRATGELWVIAVLPDYVCQGIGSQLLQAVETWLWSEGCSELWLTTDTNRALRAYTFYRQRGWVEWKEQEGQLYLKKLRNSPG